MDNEEHIDLGVSMKEKYSESPMAIPAPTSKPEEMDEKVYPSFHYSGPVELDLPDEGTMEIMFRKTSETSSVRKDGKHWYDCEIEVRCIHEVESDEPDAPTSSDHSAEEALDTLARKLSEKRSNGEASKY